MSRFPHGFFAVLLLLFFFLVAVSSSQSQELVISETDWNGLKLHYAQLKTAHQFLSVSLETSQSTISELNKNLAMQWLQMNTAKNSVMSLQVQLLTAQTQAALLETQLTESANSLDGLKKETRRQKAKAYVIGGAVGLGLGIIAGVILGSYLGG